MGSVINFYGAPNSFNLFDTDQNQFLTLACGSNLTAGRILTFTPGDAARTITLSGNPTLADWFDQSVKMTDGPTFSGLSIASASGGEIYLQDTDSRPGANTLLGQIVGFVNDNTTLRQAVSIQFYTDAQTGASDVPGRIVFNTCPDGSTALAERMRITSAGLVGIGTTEPGCLLSVGTSTQSAYACEINSGTSVNGFFSRTTKTSGTSYGIVAESVGSSTGGNIALWGDAVNGTSNYALYCYRGLAYIESGVWTPSDERKKKDVTTLSGSLDKLKQIRGVSHKWIDDKEMDAETHYGLIAQEVALHFPHMVRTIKHTSPVEENAVEEEFLAIQPTGMIPWLVEAIKELNTRLEALEKK
jgi:hypothetical protein